MERMKVQDLFLVAILSIALKQLIKGQPWPGCSPRCGNVKIEYPFGTSTHCYYPGDCSFNLECNKDNRLFIGALEVVSMSHSGELRFLVPISYTCYNNRGGIIDGVFYNVTLSSFTLSDNNSFTGVGCDSSVELTNLGAEVHATVGAYRYAILSQQKDHVLVKVAARLLSLRVGGGAKSSKSDRLAITTILMCISLIIVHMPLFVENRKFNFSGSEDVKEFPVVLDWSIGKQTCEQVGNKSICGHNSNCSDSTTRTGYICKCVEGF